MPKLRSVVEAAGLILLSVVTFAPTAKAGPNDPCFVAADNGWVKIALYTEDPHGNKGQYRWTKDFPRGASLDISQVEAGPNNRIRYDYATAPDQPLHGNVGASCINHTKIKIP